MAPGTIGPLPGPVSPARARVPRWTSADLASCGPVVGSASYQCGRGLDFTLGPRATGCPLGHRKLALGTTQRATIFVAAHAKGRGKHFSGFAAIRRPQNRGAITAIHSRGKVNNIRVTLVPSLWNTVTEHTLALMFAVARNVPQANSAVKAGK